MHPRVYTHASQLGSCFQSLASLSPLIFGVRPVPGPTAWPYPGPPRRPISDSGWCGRRSCGATHADHGPPRGGHVHETGLQGRRRSGDRDVYRHG